MSYRGLGQDGPSQHMPYMPQGSVPPVDAPHNPICVYDSRCESFEWIDGYPAKTYSTQYAVIHVNDVAAFEPKIVAHAQAHGTYPCNWSVIRSCSDSVGAQIRTKVLSTWIGQAALPVEPPPAEPPAKPFPSLPSPGDLIPDRTTILGMSASALIIVGAVVGAAFIVTRKP